MIKSTGLSVKGLRTEFNGIFSPLDAAALYNRLCTRLTSDRDSENHKWLGSVPAMREWGTGRLAKGVGTYSYNVPNRKFELTLEVDRDEIDDDQTGQIRMRIAEMAQVAAQHKDLLLGEAIEAGSSGLAYDGLSFFNDSHVHSSGSYSTAQDNDLTYAAATGTTPTVAEAQGSVEAAIAAMMGFKQDNGEPAWNGSVSGLVAVVHPSVYFTFRTAMNAAILAQTSNVSAGLADVVMFPRLTADPKYWYLFKTDGVVRPFFLQERSPIEFAAVDQPDSPDVFKTEKFLYGVRARYNLVYGAWQYAVRTTFT